MRNSHLHCHEKSQRGICQRKGRQGYEEERGVPSACGLGNVRDDHTGRRPGSGPAAESRVRVVAPGTYVAGFSRAVPAAVATRSAQTPEADPHGTLTRALSLVVNFRKGFFEALHKFRIRSFPLCFFLKGRNVGTSGHVRQAPADSAGSPAAGPGVAHSEARSVSAGTLPTVRPRGGGGPRTGALPVATPSAPAAAPRQHPGARPRAPVSSPAERDRSPKRALSTLTRHILSRHDRSACACNHLAGRRAGPEAGPPGWGPRLRGEGATGQGGRGRPAATSCSDAPRPLSTWTPSQCQGQPHSPGPGRVSC